MKKILLILLLGLTTFIQAQNVSNGEVIKVTENELFNTFKQDLVHFQGWLSKFGGGGNCASIALIKSSIGTFGINGVFKEVKVDSINEIIYVTRRDDKVIDLNFDRLENGKDHFFITSKKDEKSILISEYAKFCFAVMCRAKQLNMGYDKKYFYRGVDKLNKGQATIDIYKLLGLKKKTIEDLSIENISKFKNVVLWNSPHAVYSSSGNYDEFFRGTKTGIEPLKKLGKFHCKKGSKCPITGAYILQ